MCRQALFNGGKFLNNFSDSHLSFDWLMPASVFYSVPFIK
jgi:hypothetical protein